MIREQVPARDTLLLKLGHAQGEAGASARLVTVEVAETGALTYQLDRRTLREVRRREGRYLLRTDLVDYDSMACAVTTCN